MTPSIPPLLRILATAWVLLVLALACGGGSGASTGSTPAVSTCPLPTALVTPSWSLDVLPALQSSCGSGTSSCHGTTGIPAGHFSFFTGGGRTAAQVYGDLVGAIPSNAPSDPRWRRVAAGDPTFTRRQQIGRAHV